MQKSRIGRTLANAALAAEIMNLNKLAKENDTQVLDKARRHLAQRMGKMRGLPQKIGQLFSLADDDTKAEAYAELHQGGQPLPLSHFLAALEKNSGKSWTSMLADIEERGNAASIGQVHRASSHDHGEVAVKVSFPGIDKALRADLATLKTATKAQNLFSGAAMDRIVAQFSRDIENELDYEREAALQEHYRGLVANPAEIVVPAVVGELSGPGVLVSQWQSGSTLGETVSWPQACRFRLASQLVKHCFTMLFDHGLAHADPHQGNYRFRRDPEQIVLYDFGSVLQLERERRLALLALIRATQRGQGDPFTLMTRLGFNPALLLPLRHKLPHLCTVLFEPFHSPAKYDPTHWNRNERLADLLGDDRWNFRAGAPADLIFLVRCFQGLLFYLNRWQTQVSWHLLLQPVLNRHQTALDTFENGTVGDADFRSVAQHLAVTLWRDGVKKVQLRFPADAVERLESLIGDDIHRKISRAGIDLSAVKRQARRQAYQPTTLIDYQDPDDNQRIVVALGHGKPNGA